MQAGDATPVPRNPKAKGEKSSLPARAMLVDASPVEGMVCVVQLLPSEQDRD